MRRGQPRWWVEAGRVTVVVAGVLVAIFVTWLLSSIVLALRPSSVVGAVVLASTVTIGVPLAAALWKHGRRLRARLGDVGVAALASNTIVAAAAIVAAPDPLGTALREHGWAFGARVSGEPGRVTALSSMASYAVADAIDGGKPSPAVRIAADVQRIVVDVELVGPDGRRHRAVYLWDTGASFTTISRRTAAAIGIEIPEDAPTAMMNTAAGGRQAPLVYLPRLELAGTVIEGITASVCDDCEHDPVEGLLGLNVMRHFDSQYHPATGSLELVPRTDAAVRDQAEDIAPFVEIAIVGEPLVQQHHVHWVVAVTNRAPRTLRHVRPMAAFGGQHALVGTEIDVLAPHATVRTRIVGAIPDGAGRDFEVSLSSAQW